MKHTLLKSALCLCLLLPACNNQQESTQPEGTKPESSKQESKILESKDSSSSAEETAPAPTTDTQKTAAPAMTQPQGDIISGKVLETMDAGGYTYMKVDTGKVQQWVATPQAKVKTGDEVSYYDGMVMPNFTSKTLNKTFDSIVFSSGLVGQTPPQTDAPGMGGAMNSANPNPHASKSDATMAAGADSFASALQAEAGPASALGTKQESGGSIGAMAPFAEIKVEKAAGENGYTVAEVFADSTKLDGKTIRVQGKMVKFSPQIMGKNWIHLQDGTGDPLKNTHDLVITTSAQPPEGKEVITIEGIVRANKDFGAGYSYVVLVEEAQIVP